MSFPFSNHHSPVIQPGSGSLCNFIKDVTLWGSAKWYSLVTLFIRTAPVIVSCAVSVATGARRHPWHNSGSVWTIWHCCNPYFANLAFINQGRGRISGERRGRYNWRCKNTVFVELMAWKSDSKRWSLIQKHYVNLLFALVITSACTCELHSFPHSEYLCFVARIKVEF